MFVGVLREQTNLGLNTILQEKAIRGAVNESVALKYRYSRNLGGGPGPPRYAVCISSPLIAINHRIANVSTEGGGNGADCFRRGHLGRNQSQSAQDN